jgi:cytochrome c
MRRALLASVLALGSVAPLAPATAADPAALRRGEEIYGRCLGCHAIEQHRTGPAHCGLFQRLAGSAPGFEHYSDAMRRSGIRWNEATLERFLADPMAVVPGTTMTYQGVTAPGDRRDLIAWLKESTVPGQSCRPPR